MISNEKILTDPDLADLTGYYAHQVAANDFVLKHESDEEKEQFLIVMRQTDDKKVMFDGLSQEMKKHLSSFSYEEKIKYPTTVLNVIIKQTY